MKEPRSPSSRKDYMPSSKRHSPIRLHSLQAWKNLYKPVTKLMTKSEQTGKLVMPSHAATEDSSLVHLALVPAHTLAPWTYLGPNTTLRSQDQLLTKKRSATGTITCAYTVVLPAIGLLNAPIRYLEETPHPLLLPPLKEVCSFLLLLCLVCLPPLLPLPKSSMRQKTRFRCK